MGFVNYNYVERSLMHTHPPRAGENRAKALGVPSFEGLLCTLYRCITSCSAEGAPEGVAVWTNRQWSSQQMVLGTEATAGTRPSKGS